MRKKLPKNRITALIVTVVMLLTLPLALWSCSVGGKSTLTVDILKIGKADSIIINEGEHTVVIDCGEKDDASEIIAQLKADGVDRIDYLIITHFDKDHVGAAAAVLGAYKIDHLIEPDYEPIEPREEYLSYRTALETAGITPQVLSSDMSFSLGAAKYEIFATDKTYSDDLDNNTSLMVGMKHQDNSFLFAGDVEKDRIKDILGSGIGHYDFLKVPHHGDYNKQSVNFIQAISPNYAAITCSAKNQPSQEILDALNTINCKIYSTKDSEVHVTSTAEGIHVDQSGT